MAESLPLLTEDFYLDEQGRPTGTAIAQFDDPELSIDEAALLIRDNVLNRHFIRTAGMVGAYDDKAQFDPNDGMDPLVDEAMFLAETLARGYANQGEPLTAQMIDSVNWVPALQWTRDSGILEGRRGEKSMEGLLNNAIRYQRDQVKGELVIAMYESGVWLSLNDAEMETAAEKFLQEHERRHPNELYPTANLTSVYNVTAPVPEMGGMSFVEQAAGREINLSNPDFAAINLDDYPKEIRDTLQNQIDSVYATNIEAGSTAGVQVLGQGLEAVRRYSGSTPAGVDSGTSTTPVGGNGGGTGQGVFGAEEVDAQGVVAGATTQPFNMGELYEMFQLDPGYVSAFNDLNYMASANAPVDENGVPDPNFLEMQRALREDNLWQWPTAGLMQGVVPERVIGEPGRKVSTWDLLFMPRTMTRQQRIDLHYNLMMGGYYERVGSVPLFVGDANDEAFNSAYRLFIGDILADSRQGQPTTPAERMRQSQQQNFQRLQDQVNKVTRDDVYNLARQLSRSVLGRDPYDNEIEALVRQVKQMDLTAVARGEASIVGEQVRTITGVYESREPSVAKQQGQAMTAFTSAANRAAMFSRVLQPDPTTEEVVRDVMGEINE